MSILHQCANRLGLIDFLHALLPPVCSRCERALPLHTHAPSLCNPCWSMVYTPMLVHDADIHLHTWSSGIYTQWMAQQLQNAKWKATPASLLFWQTVVRTHASQFQTQPWDAIIAMPYHPWRLVQRGYSLPHWMAHQLQKAWPHLQIRQPLRKMPRPAQAKQPDFKSRAHNIRQAFTVKDEVDRQRFLLIDDVRTSGSTLHAAAKALYQAGAKKVDAYVLLQAPQPKTKKT